MRENVEDFEMTLANAHPRAKALMHDDFFFDPLQETAPFGNDDGFDAAYGFKDFRETYPTTSPLVYLQALVQQFNYAPFNWNELDTDIIEAYLDNNELGDSMLIGADNAILGTAFMQIALEGRIDEDLQAIAQVVITRQQLPVLLDLYDLSYIETRITQLHRMREVLKNINA